MGYQSAEDRVEQDDIEKVMAVLCRPSPWQQYIVPNVKEARSNMGKPVFQIINSTKFSQVMQSLDDHDDSNDTPGVTDKKTGRIFMQDSFGQNAGYAMLGHSLHETVHLVSHPPGIAQKGKSSARNILAKGLFEGLVECVTEDILNTQGITLARQSKRGHVDRVPVIRNLFKILETRNPPLPPVPFFGKLLFSGTVTVNHIQAEMDYTFTIREWTQISRLATDNKKDAAIDAMNKVAARQGLQHAKEDEAIREHFRKLRQFTTPDILPGVQKP